MKNEATLTTREANIDGLRILSCFMIICIHVLSVGLTENNINVGSLNWQISNVLSSLSRVAVPCFVLITGYFMFAKRVEVFETIKKTFLPLFFYSIIIYFVYLAKQPEIVVPAMNAFKAFVGSYSVFHHFWYIYVYVILVLLLPFLNQLIINLSKKMHLYLLSVLYISSTILPTINQFSQTLIIPDELVNSRLLLFITLYTQGAYIRIYKAKLTKKLLIIIYFLSCSAIALLTSVFSVSANKFVGSFYDYSNIFVIIGAVSLFSFFTQLNVFSSRFINLIASCTYGTYLIHVLFITVFQWSLPNELIPFADYNNSKFIFKNLFYIFLVFICSITVEFIRIRSTKIIRQLSLKIQTIVQHKNTNISL
ncbi:acyltransferase [Paenibacillus elgii]